MNTYKTYMISYDLNKPGQNYEKLILEIKKFNGWCHILKSTWLVRSTGSAEDIWQHLAKFADKNDSLFVNELTNNYRGWVSSVACNWLKDHMS